MPVQPVRRGPFCPICLLALLWALLLAFLLAQRLTTLVCQNSETRPLQSPPASLVIVTPTAIGLPATPQAPQTAAPTIDPQLSFGATPTPVSQRAIGPHRQPTALRS